MADTTGTPTDTAVIIPLPTTEPAVGHHRRRLDVAASWGVGAHVSVLYPFAPPEAVDEGLLARLGQALASVAAFDCVFARCAWFADDVLWLAPEPDQPFRELTTAVSREFPQYPPYGGAHATIIPHLTVGEARRGTVGELRAAEAAVTDHLPIRAHVDRAVLIAGSAAPDSWQTLREFPLGGESYS